MKETILRILFITCLSLFYGTTTFAQEPPSIPERRALAARRDKYVCKELNLTNEECTKLTIILHQLDEERMNIWSNFGHLHMQLKKKAQVSQEEMAMYLKMKSECKIKEAKLMEEYYLKLSNILSPEKLLELDKAQKCFGRELSQERLPK
ncbi:hypothetical protein [Porphyromonas sp.]